MKKSTELETTEKRLAEAVTDWWHYHDFNRKERLKGLMNEAKLLAEAVGKNLTDADALKAANLKHTAWDVHKKAEVAEILGADKKEEWEKVTKLLEEYFKIILRK